MKTCTKILHEMWAMATRIDQGLTHLNIRNVMYRQFFNHSYDSVMPSCSDQEIEELCNQIPAISVPVHFRKRPRKNCGALPKSSPTRLSTTCRWQEVH